MEDLVLINRAPVLTLWAAVVAERLGYDWAAALSLGKCLAGLNAQAKGRRLGIYGPPATMAEGAPPKRRGLGEEFWLPLCGRPLPAKNTPEGVRAMAGTAPIEPAPVQTYLEKKFGAQLAGVCAAMRALAQAFGPAELEDRAYGLYEAFRPEIPRGTAGWGAKGELRLDLLRSLATRD